MDFKLVGAFIILILIATILLLFKKINSKKYMIFVLASLATLFGICIFMNYKILANTFDNFATQFFMNIYFPSIYVYILMLVISFVFFIVSIFNIMMKKSYKVINTCLFVINNVLLVLILNLIAKNKIDIFSVNSLYTNTNLVAILEINTGVFIVWIFALIIAFATDCIWERLAHKKVYVNETVKDNISDTIELDTTDYVTDDVNNISNVVDSMPNEEINNLEDTVYVSENALMNTVTFNDYLEDNGDNKEITYNSIDNNDVIKRDVNTSFSDILNGNIPVTYYDNKVGEEEYNLANPQKMYEDKYKEDKMVIPTYDIELSDLVKKDSDNEVLSDKKIDDSVHYTISDYRKALDMLNSIKAYSVDNNINIDDALAISMISNYSIEDCLKFKNILKSNLN